MSSSNFLTDYHESRVNNRNVFSNDILQALFTVHSTKGQGLQL